MRKVVPPTIRKRLIDEASPSRQPLTSPEIQVASNATIHYSSEDPANPIENLFDGASGPGATRWQGAKHDMTQEVLLEFDQAQHISRLIYDVEEQERERTQEVRMEFSSDGGKSYRTGFIQEYTFSPHGSTYQREDLRFELCEVTHLRLIVAPNKRGSGTATLTSLRLFS
jgi:F5/8 type C domain